MGCHESVPPICRLEGYVNNTTDGQKIFMTACMITGKI